jgi:hypothetical protein
MLLPLNLRLMQYPAIKAANFPQRASRLVPSSSAILMRFLNLLPWSMVRKCHGIVERNAKLQWINSLE